MRYLSALSTDSACQLDVLGHDGDALCVNGAEVCVLKKTDQVSLGGFLQSADGGRLEPKVGLEILSDFSNQPLEWQLTDQELSRLLIPPDLSEGDGSWPVTMGLLDAAS